MLKISPLPKKRKVNKLLTFPEAIKEIMKGRKVTRVEWDSNEEYAFLKDEFLSIHTRGKDHTWLVRKVDMDGTDWVVLPEAN